MAAKIAEDGISPEKLNVIGEPTFENYSKLVVDYADAVIKGSETINPEVEQYIKSSGKKFLDYQPKESYIDSFFDFYNNID